MRNTFSSITTMINLKSTIEESSYSVNYYFFTNVLDYQYTINKTLTPENQGITNPHHHDLRLAVGPLPDCGPRAKNSTRVLQVTLNLHLLDYSLDEHVIIAKLRPLCSPKIDC